jgi:hypothetical protein
VIIHTPSTKHRVRFVDILSVYFLDNKAVEVWVYDIVLVLTNPHETCGRFVALVV